MSDSKDAHFATHLTHQFNLVDQQVQAGIYVIKRTSAYMKKIVTHHLEAAAALEKATKNEATKVTALQKDGMAGHVSAVINLQAIFQAIVQKHKDFAARVTNDVIKPFEAFQVSGEKKRSDITKKESRATGKLNTVYSKAKAQRAKCQKKWDEIQKMNKLMQGMEDLTAKKVKQEKELKKNLDQAAQLFKQYEQYIEEAYAAAQGYFSSEIPELLNEMEALEKERLQLLQHHLQSFAKIYADWDKPTPPGCNYSELLDKLDVKADIEKCVNDRVSEVGMPQGPPELPPPLPCKSSDFSTGDWLNPQAPAPKSFSKVDAAGPPKSVPPSPSSVSESKLPPSASFHVPPPAVPSTPVAQAVPPPVHAAPEQHEEKSDEAASSPVSEDAGAAFAEVQGRSGRARSLYGQAPHEEGPVQYCRGVYDYQTDHADDLQFKVGDVIRLLSPNVDFASHDPNNPVWLLGELVSNPEANGSFPSNYVEQCDAEGK